MSVSMVMSLTVTPGTAQSGLESSPWQIYTSVCFTGTVNIELPKVASHLRYKEYTSSSGRQSKLLITDKNVSFLAKQLVNTS